MKGLYQNLYTSDATRQIEESVMRKEADKETALDGFELMTRAARFALRSILENGPDFTGLTIFCGKGNNAGDGYLIAKLAQEAGFLVQVISVFDPAFLSPDAKRAFDQAVRVGVVVESDTVQIRFNIVIDAIFGIGLRKGLPPNVLNCIDRINAHSGFVVALDVPTGIDSDTGSIDEDHGTPSAVKASLTICFITLKQGLFTGKARSFSGRKLLGDLGVDKKYLFDRPSKSLLRWDASAAANFEGSIYKHKRGRLLILGGDEGMGGAVIMAANAALRVGTGLVVVGCRGSHHGPLLSRLPEVMTLEVSEEGSISTLGSYDLILIGPGLGRSDWGKKVFETALASGLPLVIDADGLYWLSTEKSVTEDRTFFITPHSGEAARLLGVESSDIERNRFQAAESLSIKYHCAGVLKGPGSIVFVGKDHYVCDHGGPAMASAGMGDVLAGTVAGMLASNALSRIDPRDFRTKEILANAVALHSACADELVSDKSARGLLASDLAEHLPAMF